MSADAVVIGSGIVGAWCAHYLAAAGLDVVVVDRGPVSSGTTGAGEGNILVSDKEPGPELDLALLSRDLWATMPEPIADACELDPKGGLVTAADDHALAALLDLAGQQRGAGVDAREVAAADIAGLEPWIAADLAGAVHYPQDMQCQPMLAAAHLIAAAPRVTMRAGCEVTGIDTAGGRVRAVRTPQGDIPTAIVVNAAGTWGGQVAALAGADVPILPRRGFILVTQPLPHRINHKVYAADYVANVASDSAALESSAVVEGTRSGTILIGASRERVGFDRTLDWRVLARLAAQAVALFPFLAEVRLLRTYGGFRPYCPDHLPVIGPDASVAGLFHAVGHEGAGVGLAPATGLLVAQAAVGEAPRLDLAPFAPERFAGRGAA